MRLILPWSSTATQIVVSSSTSGATVVNPSVVTAMIATHELAREPGATIVCNKITSRVVPEVVQAEGGKMVITRVGHTFVKAAMAEHNAIFGGEHSAHYYFRDFWGADTGMLAALHVLAAVGHADRPLSNWWLGSTGTPLPERSTARLRISR